MCCVIVDGLPIRDRVLDPHIVAPIAADREIFRFPDDPTVLKARRDLLVRPAIDADAAAAGTVRNPGLDIDHCGGAQPIFAGKAPVMNVRRPMKLVSMNCPNAPRPSGRRMPLMR